MQGRPSISKPPSRVRLRPHRNVENPPKCGKPARPGYGQTKGIKDNLWTGVARVKIVATRRAARRSLDDAAAVGRCRRFRASLLPRLARANGASPCDGWLVDAWATPASLAEEGPPRHALAQSSRVSANRAPGVAPSPSFCRVQTLINREPGRCDPQAARWGTGRTRWKRSTAAETRCGRAGSIPAGPEFGCGGRTHGCRLKIICLAMARLERPPGHEHEGGIRR
jgi:hypothetical protein